MSLILKTRLTTMSLVLKTRLMLRLATVFCFYIVDFRHNFQMTKNHEPYFENEADSHEPHFQNKADNHEPGLNDKKP